MCGLYGCLRKERGKCRSSGFIVFPFLSTPCMAKTHFEYRYLCIWIERVPKGPSWEAELLQEINYIDQSQISAFFFPIIHCILHFLGHPVWWKYTLNESFYVFLTEGTQKAPDQKHYFYGRATIMIGVKYLHS